MKGLRRGALDFLSTAGLLIAFVLFVMVVGYLIFLIVGFASCILPYMEPSCLLGWKP